jgi:hypothetical protein
MMSHARLPRRLCFSRNETVYFHVTMQTSLSELN